MHHSPQAQALISPPFTLLLGQACCTLVFLECDSNQLHTQPMGQRAHYSMRVTCRCMLCRRCRCRTHPAHAFFCCVSLHVQSCAFLPWRCHAWEFVQSFRESVALSDWRACAKPRHREGKGHHTRRGSAIFRCEPQRSQGSKTTAGSDKCNTARNVSSTYRLPWLMLLVWVVAFVRYHLRACS
jgi:hypothetical protein